MCFNGGLPLKRKSIKDVIGETIEHKKALKGVNYLLTFEQAQLLVRLICRAKRWRIPKLIYTKRKTIFEYGYCYPVERIIGIHKTHETVQNVLHEMAHIKSPNHDKIFKKTMLNLINYYKTKLIDIIFKEEN